MLSCILVANEALAFRSILSLHRRFIVFHSQYLQKYSSIKITKCYLSFRPLERPFLQQSCNLQQSCERLIQLILSYHASLKSLHAIGVSVRLYRSLFRSVRFFQTFALYTRCSIAINTPLCNGDSFRKFWPFMPKEFNPMIFSCHEGTRSYARFSTVFSSMW